jgi:hypothetical protein
MSFPEAQECIPLDVCVCDSCKHVQLMQIVDPGHLFANYPYVSSASRTMVEHLTNNIDIFVDGLDLSDHILEIGANDGVGIAHLLSRGFTNAIGIDPAENVHARHSLPIICDYFGPKSLDLFEENKFKLIFAFHCCAHIEDIRGVFETARKLLDDVGIFIVEVGYFLRVLQHGSFDTIYHEHIDYHTCRAMQQFATSTGLMLYNVRETDIQGGSIQFYFAKNRPANESVALALALEDAARLHDHMTLDHFRMRVGRCMRDMKVLMRDLATQGRTVAGYGASAKSTTFLHQFLTSGSQLSFIADDSVRKQGLWSPGLHIPIKPFCALDTDHVDFVIILSWNYAEQLIQRLQQHSKRGLRIIIPFPELKII